MNKHSRPSIKEILSEDYWKNNENETKLSLKDIIKMVGILGSLTIISGSGIFLVPLIVSPIQKLYGKIGIKCKKTMEQEFFCSYSIAVLSLVLSLKAKESNIVAIDDTQDGSIIEAELPPDWKCFPGRLFFEIFDKGTSIILIKGMSIIKGQLIDYGKGKKTLREIFANTELTIHKITSNGIETL